MATFNVSSIEPSDQLTHAIIVRITAARLHQARVRFFVLGSVSVVACVSLVPAVQFLVREAAQSGLSQYLSLFASDRSFIVGAWQQYVATVTEAIPFFAATMVLAITGAFLGSVRVALTNMKYAFNRHQLV